MAKDVPEVFSQPFGQKEVEIDTGFFTISMCKRISRAYAQAKAQFSDVRKYPMNVGESQSDWQKRIQKEKDVDVVLRRKVKNDEGELVAESPEEQAIRIEQVEQIGIDIYVEI